VGRKAEVTADVRLAAKRDGNALAAIRPFIAEVFLATAIIAFAAEGERDVEQL
jgi:hypothetical protein